GLTRRLDAIDVKIPADDQSAPFQVRDRPGDEARWILRSISAGESYAAALAVEHRSPDQGSGSSIGSGCGGRTFLCLSIQSSRRLSDIEHPLPRARTSLHWFSRWQNPTVMGRVKSWGVVVYPGCRMSRGKLVWCAAQSSKACAFNRSIANERP